MTCKMLLIVSICVIYSQLYKSLDNDMIGEVGLYIMKLSEFYTSKC